MNLLIIAAFFIICLSASIFLTKRILPLLRAKRCGQSILEIGPAWHKAKEGTPTMGGIVFLIVIPLSVTILLLLLGEKDLFLVTAILLFALANGLIGLLDDMTKRKKSQNSGLSPWQKLVLQTLSVILLLFFLYRYDPALLFVKLPFSELDTDLSLLSLFLLLFLLVGSINCANLTDGIDGLAASVAFIIGIHFATEGALRDRYELLALGIALSATVLGFLLFNIHPAKIFMGDTGSLFLGGLVAAGAFLMNNPLSLLFYGFVYVLEGISVVLQVIIYKRTRKRLFLMAPLHHHLEKRGWDESKIVLSAVLLSVLGGYLSHFA